MEEELLLEHDLRVLLNEFLVESCRKRNRFMHENHLATVHRVVKTCFHEVILDGCAWDANVADLDCELGRNYFVACVVSDYVLVRVQAKFREGTVEIAFAPER